MFQSESVFFDSAFIDAFTYVLLRESCHLATEKCSEQSLQQDSTSFSSVFVCFCVCLLGLHPVVYDGSARVPIVRRTLVGPTCSTVTIGKLRTTVTCLVFPLPRVLSIYPLTGNTGICGGFSVLPDLYASPSEK